MPAYEHLNRDLFVTLYRGLAEVTPKDIEQKNLGSHWSVDPNIAYNFATSRDVEGSHDWMGFDKESSPHGTVVTAKVHKRHIIDPESEEGERWHWEMGALGHGNIEQERTVRPGAIVHVQGMHHATEDGTRFTPTRSRRGWKA